jgi:hypothetical protein
MGGNPIAKKLGLHLLSPSGRPSRVGSTIASREATVRDVHTCGKPALATCTALENASARDTVVLRAYRSVPERPALAQSFANGLQMVSDRPDRAGPQGLRFEGLNHDKLLQVFDHLKNEIDSWQELATVQEEAMEHVDAEIGNTFLTDVVVDEQVSNTPLNHAKQAIKNMATLVCCPRSRRCTTYTCM